MRSIPDFLHPAPRQRSFGSSEKRIPLCRPAGIDVDEVTADIRSILESGVLTNGSYVRRLEDAAAERLGVAHCVAVSSCTAGLMLVLRAAGLSGDVVVPSFTFAATAHAVAWNGLRPVFADIDPKTLTLSATSAGRAVGVRASAILATHVYGTPCDIEGLARVAEANGLRLFFDAAHAFGSFHRGVPVGGFGDAEVFSLSPTKLLVAAEGGIIATNNDVLAERCRIGRDYGNPGDYNCRFVGLNARMSELHAVVALSSLRTLDDRIERRNRVVRLYRELLADVVGVSFPLVPEGDRSTYKDLTVLIDPDEFGLDAQALSGELSAEGIETRRYYSPPVHEMRAYRGLAGPNGSLAVTAATSQRVVTLPLWSGMAEAEVAEVCGYIAQIRELAVSGTLTGSARDTGLVP